MNEWSVAPRALDVGHGLVDDLQGVAVSRPLVIDGVLLCALGVDIDLPVFVGICRCIDMSVYVGISVYAGICTS